MFSLFFSFAPLAGAFLFLREAPFGLLARSLPGA
jgi:hypothetical protein